MARKKKKKMRNLLLLVLVAILCMGSYIGVHQYMAAKEEASDDSEEDTTETFLNTETDTATKLSYTAGDNSVTLVNEDGEWKLESDKDCPVEQSYVTTMLSVFSATDATKKIADDTENASEYGVDEPTLEATLTLEDGTSVSYQVGIAAIGDSTGYYATASTLDGIYLVPETVYTSFDYTSADLVAIEDTPEITSDYLYSIAISDKDSTIFEADKDMDEESSNYDNWTIGAPYSSSVLGDTTALTTLAANYTSFTFTQNVDYDCTDLSKYGLDTPAYTIELKYLEEVETESDDSDATATDDASDTEDDTETVTEKRSFTLYIGSTDSDGNYYVQMKGSDSVYLMSESSVSTLIDVTAFDNVSTIIVNTEFASVSEITAKTEDETYKLTVEAVETDDSDSDDTDSEATDSEDTDSEDSSDDTSSTTYNCTLNGNTLDEDDAISFYSTLTALTYKSEITEEVSDAKTVLTLTIVSGTNKDEKTISFKTYDDNYYQVVVDGTALFTTDKRDIDSIISALADM